MQALPSLIIPKITATPAPTPSSTYKRGFTGGCAGTPLTTRRKVDVAAAAAAATSTLPLSPEQQKIVDRAVAGESFFFTGAAGTGKSYTLRQIVEALKGNRPAGTVFVTASTGVAACNIGGITLHSFAGVGLARESIVDLNRMLSKRPKNRERWRKCRCLIVDEISMISGELFDKFEALARGIRRNTNPFGGIQVILCGDFFQLPPVFDRGGNGPLCFEASSWGRVVRQCYQLKTVFRQKDPGFVTLLNEVRLGCLSTESRARLEQCRGTVWDDTDAAVTTEPTRLFPHCAAVQRTNLGRLATLPGAEREYIATDFVVSEAFRSVLENTPAPAQLILKEGAQVMLLKNLDFASELVNGSIGVVVGFDSDENDCPIVLFRNGVKRTIVREEWGIDVGIERVACRTQVPLALAWALSIHKSQGVTLERVELTMAHVFAEGQAYVALSRVTSLEGLKLIGDMPPSKALIPNPKVVKFYDDLQSIA